MPTDAEMRAFRKTEPRPACPWCQTDETRTPRHAPECPVYEYMGRVHDTYVEYTVTAIRAQETGEKGPPCPDCGAWADDDLVTKHLDYCDFFAWTQALITTQAGIPTVVGTMLFSVEGKE